MLVGRELEHRDVDALALGPRAEVGRAVERVLLGRGQAAAAGAGAVTQGQGIAVDAVAEELRHGRIGRLAVGGRGRLRARPHRVVEVRDVLGVLGVALRVGQPDHAHRGARQRARHVDRRGVGEVLGALGVLEAVQRGVEGALYLGARTGGAHQERRARRHHGQAAGAQVLGHRRLGRRAWARSGRRTGRSTASDGRTGCSCRTARPASCSARPRHAGRRPPRSASSSWSSCR